MFNANPFVTTYSPQAINDRIDNEIEKLKQMKISSQQPIINQTFQQSMPNAMRYANSLEEVNKEVVFVETPFFSKDMSILWVKDAQNKTKTYELIEIIEKDEKSNVMKTNEEKEEERKKLENELKKEKKKIEKKNCELLLGKKIIIL